MYFYQLKHGGEVGWVLLNETQFDHLFKVYFFSFKKINQVEMSIVRPTKAPFFLPKFYS